MKLIEAKLVRDADAFGSMDCYAKLELLGLVKKTKALKGAG